MVGVYSQISAAARVSSRRVLATDDDLDVHTALTGAHECVDKMAVGNEVGVFDEDRFARGIDGEKEAGPQGVAPGIRITDAEMGELVACG